MDFDEFRGRYETAEKLSLSGDDRAASAALSALAADPGLPDLDRAMIWAQAAGVHERLGETDASLAAYDRAAALEAPHKRFQALFKKADYLLRLGRKDESRDLYKSLLERPDATLAERHSIESRLKLLRRVASK
jgi:tetratricopeptide (TPR) repeat protein